MIYCTNVLELSKKLVILHPIFDSIVMDSLQWLKDLFVTTDSVAHIVLLYALVIAVGVYLGKIKIGGISLGVTFVLFAGILAGHVGFTAPTPILTFVQDFGLILFVFMIGMQVGPGFFESFGKQGINLNMMAAIAILLNIAVMFVCYFVFFDTSNVNNLPMMVGTLYGAVTNTPGLGAANEALGTVFGANAPQIASAYACAYPLGVLGIIGATIIIRYACRVKLEKEEQRLKAMEETSANKKPYKMHLEVTNKYLEGKTLLQVHDFLNRDFVVSRLVHQGELCIPNRDTIFHVGDQMLIVCAEADQEAITAFIGPKLDIDFEQQDQPLVSKRILITNPAINGKTLASMHFSSVHGVNVTRLTRHGIDLFASAGLPLYTTTSANMMLREIGLVLFLASVGIKAGAGFFETVIEGDGLLYVLTGFLITVIPILIVGPIARMKFRFNYFTIAGMIAGTYTDPPALAYANSICSKEAPALGYSTVYPLSMFLRIFTAQIIVLFFCG